MDGCLRTSWIHSPALTEHMVKNASFATSESTHIQFLPQNSKFGGNSSRLATKKDKHKRRQSAPKEDGRIRHDSQSVVFHDRVDDGSDALEVVLGDGLVWAIERSNKVDEGVWGAPARVYFWADVSGVCIRRT